MQASNIETYKSRTRSTRAKAASRLASPEAAAFDALQAAILRLASKPLIRPGNHGRQELGALVEQALKAYREYMKVVETAANR